MDSLKSLSFRVTSSAFISTQVLYIGVRLVWRRQTASAWHVAGLILASAIYAFCQSAIAGALGETYFVD